MGKKGLGALGLAAAGILMAACTGPKGDLGPSGPQGAQGTPPAPSYYYSSNFDTQANLSEWSVYQSGGSGSIQTYFDTVSFVSPTRAMGVSVTGSVAGDSSVFRSIAFDASKEICVEFDFLLPSVPGEFEVVVNAGSVSHLASFGWDGSQVFLSHQGTRYYPAGSISTSLWHHAKIVANPGTGKSSYWLDGATLGKDYAVNTTPVGQPPSTSYLGIKLLFGSGVSVKFDNFACYRY